jgi:hypothetical protein
MALQASKGFLLATTATLLNNTKVINFTGGIDCSFVSSGTAIFLDGGNTLVEGVSGTPPDVDGNSSITIRKLFTGTTLTNTSMAAFNTIEGLRDAIQRSREIADLSLATNEQLLAFFTSTAPIVSMTIGGTTFNIEPYRTLLARV